MGPSPTKLTEARYRCCGNVYSSTEPQALRNALLAAMDGWMSTNGKGHIVIKAGRYDEPTFVLTPEHIRGATWRTFQPGEEVVNAITASYLSAEHDYSNVEAGQWRDEDDITERGVERAEPLTVACPSAAQALRLARRKGVRMGATHRGQVRADIHGLNGLGQRYIQVQNPIIPSMADVVCEVINAEIDFASASVIFDVILADPDIDEDDETVVVPDPVVRPAPEPGYQEPAVTPISRDVTFPTTATDVQIAIDAFTAILPDGSSLALPADTITGLDPSKVYGVFYREDEGYTAAESPATAQKVSGGRVFVGWQATEDGSGTFPTPPTRPGGSGGDGTMPTLEP